MSQRIDDCSIFNNKKNFSLKLLLFELSNFEYFRRDQKHHNKICWSTHLKKVYCAENIKRTCKFLNNYNTAKIDPTLSKTYYMLESIDDLWKHFSISFHNKGDYHFKTYILSSFLYCFWNSTNCLYLYMSDV